MRTLEYGSKKTAQTAWDEIHEGRPVALTVRGWKRGFIHRALTLYAEYDRQSRSGKIRKALLVRLALRTLLTPSLIGLCHHAQASGFAVGVRDIGDALEIRFEKPEQHRS